MKLDNSRSHKQRVRSYRAPRTRFSVPALTDFEPPCIDPAFDQAKEFADNDPTLGVVQLMLRRDEECPGQGTMTDFFSALEPHLHRLRIAAIGAGMIERDLSINSADLERIALRLIGMGHGLDLDYVKGFSIDDVIQFLEKAIQAAELYEYLRGSPALKYSFEELVQMIRQDREEKLSGIVTRKRSVYRALQQQKRDHPEIFEMASQAASEAPS